MAELTQNFEVEELVLVSAAEAAKGEEGGGRGRGWCLKWQDCITSQRGNRRKARKNGKQERRGRVTCVWHSLVFFFLFQCYIFKLAERGQTSLQKFVVFIRYKWKGV